MFLLLFLANVYNPKIFTKKIRLKQTLCIYLIPIGIGEILVSARFKIIS